jgi:DNA-directed RNA polymerase alpha subunit
VDLTELGLPDPLIRRLAYGDITTVDELAALTYNDLRDIRWIGELKAARIEAALAAVGRGLREGL